MSKISELPVAGALTGAEIIPVVQGGITKATTMANIFNSDPRFPTADEKASFPATASGVDPLALASDARFPTTDEKAGLAGLSAADPAVQSSEAVHNVATIAALRLLPVVAGKAVQPLGYYAAGDGGGGPIRVGKTGAAPGTYVDNGVSIIVPTGGDGSAAWVWEWSGAINVQWCGAKGDGVTDDAAAIQAACALAAGVKVDGNGTGAKAVRIPDGNYAISETVTVPIGVTLHGDGPAVSRINSASGVVALDISGGVDQVIEDLSVYSAGGAGSIGIKADMVTRPLIYNTFIVGTEYGVKGSKTLYPILRKMYIDAGIKGVELSGGAGTWNVGWYNNVVTMDNVRAGGIAASTTGIDITGMGVLMLNCDTTRNLIGTRIAGTASATVNKSQTATIIGHYNEDCDKPFKFENCRQVTIISNYSQGKASGSGATCVYDLDESTVYVLSNTLLDYFKHVAVCTNNSSIRWPQSFTSYVDTAFSSVDGTSSATVMFSGNAINSAITFTDIALGASNATLSSFARAVDNGVTSVIFEGRQNNGTARHRFRVGGASNWNSADAAYYASRDTTTSRSINAAGTVNASGADFAEYEKNNGAEIKKGSIVGFRADGTLTTIYAEAVRFGIKSTAPAYVGGDAWFDEPEPIPPREISSEEQMLAYAAQVDAFRQRIEAARAYVDRIAYSGKVPVNVLAATPGDYIIAAEGEDGGISGQPVSSPTFTQYLSAVGRVNRILDDGRAEVAVIVH